MSGGGFGQRIGSQISSWLDKDAVRDWVRSLVLRRGLITTLSKGRQRWLDARVLVVGLDLSMSPGSVRHGHPVAIQAFAEPLVKSKGWILLDCLSNHS